MTKRRSTAAGHPHRSVMCATLSLVSVVLLALIPAAAPAQGAAGCVNATQLGVVVVLDDSGSMADTDPGQLRRFGAGLALDQLRDGSVAGALRFASGAQELFAPTVVDAGSRPTLKDRLRLFPNGQTNFAAAFRLAGSQLSAMPSTVDGKAVIFLSDGMRNAGAANADEAIASQGIPIYTIGFGDASRTELTEIAEGAGRTGKAYFVDDAGSTQAAFADIISRVTCAAAKLEASVTLAPGEVREFPFEIAPTDRGWRGLVTWSGNRGFDVTAVRPNGSVMGPGATNSSETYEELAPTQRRLSSLRPPAGPWRLVVRASPGNPDPVKVDLRIFERDDGQAVLPVPVVLVAGIVTDVQGRSPVASPAEPCAGRVGKFDVLCGILEQEGHLVWAVQASGKSGTTINHRARIDSNARRLKAELEKLALPSPPLIVGHSMGGVIARVAMARHKAPASGLITLGSPHDGSFIADLTVTGTVAGALCRLPVCAAVGLAAKATQLLSGPDALNDLTSAARSRDNASIPALRAPIWRVAGTAVSVPSFMSNPYVFPNDGVVAQDSALGKAANLRAPHEGATPELSEPLWHDALVLKRPDNLLDDDRATGFVRAAALELSSGAPVATRSIAALRVSSGAQAAASTPRATKRAARPLVLTATSGRGLARGKPIPVPNTRSILARAPFQLNCGGRRVDAVQLGRGLYGTFVTGCRRPQVVASRPMSIVRMTDAAKIRATVLTTPTRVRVRLTAGSRRLTAVHARVGGRPVRAKRSGRAWTLTLDRRRVLRSRAQIHATNRGVRYSAPLSLPR